MPPYKRQRSETSVVPRRGSFAGLGSRRATPSKRVKRLFKDVSRAQSGTLLMIPRNPSCFPESLVTDLFYTEQFTLSISSGVGTTQRWRGNSVYDPDYTGVGGVQPKYYDALSTVYQKYEVFKSVCEVVLYPPNPTTSNNGHEVVLASTASTFVDFSEFLNSEHGSAGFLGSANGSGPLRLVSYGDTTKLTGYTRGDDTLVASTGANPNQIWYFSLGSQSREGGSDTIYGIVRIRYTCRFSHMFESDS